MSTDQGPLRHDQVALGALLNAYLLGLIPTDKVLSGRGHSAVIIIVMVVEIMAMATAIPMILLLWMLRAIVPRSAPTLFCAAPAA